MPDRRYRKTHPWIDFTLRLDQAPYDVWTLLGEACSKCEQIANSPLDPAAWEEMRDVYLAKGALATTAIEGNTLSQEEVAKRVRGIHDLPPSREYLGQEVDNVLEAFDGIISQLDAGTLRPLTPHRVKEMNRLVLRGLQLAPEVVPGEFSRTQVGVGAYLAAPVEDSEYLLGRLCQWLEWWDSVELKCPRPGAAIFKAILAHLYLVWIHPFGDGNGRAARLMEYQILLAAGVPGPSAHLLSNHYNETRSEYYRQLQRSSQVENGAMEFVRYSLQGFVDGLRGQMEEIWEYQLNATWENFVYGQFRGETGGPAIRRRNLLLDLSQQPEPVRLANLRRITPRAAEAYANRTDSTLNRDINILNRMGLVRMTRTGVVARKERVRAYLPFARSA